MKYTVSWNFQLLCTSLFLLVSPAGSATPNRYLLSVDAGQAETILVELQKRDEVVSAQLLFGEQILVTTTSGAAPETSSAASKVVQDHAISPATIGYMSAQAEDESRSDSILYAANDPRYSASTADPLNTFQWAYQNFGYERGRAGVDSGAHAVSETGAGSVIAIASTGADHSHEDLQGALWTNDGEIAANGIDDDGNGYTDDVYGPGPLGSGDTMDQVGIGTALAGIIAATRNNGLGISGIAPGAKVLACNAALPTGQLSVSDILLCIDYVIDQKVNHGQNIVTFIAGFRGFSPFDQLIEPAMRALQDADILVIAPTYMVPPGYAAQDLDISTDAPSTMDFANILAVSAIERDGDLAFRTTGARTIDASLPGVEILTTLPGNTGIVDGSAYVDEEFESSPTDWSLSGGWQHTTSGGVGDSGSLQLNVGSGDIFSDDQLIELPPLDISTIPDDSIRLSFDLWAENMVNSDPPISEASVQLEWYSETENYWHWVAGDDDTKEGPAWQRITGDLGSNQLERVNRSALRLRFKARTTSDHMPVIAVDNLRIGPEPADQGFSNSYRYFSGTGASAAMAAAMVAILRERNPSISNAELKNLIMSSGQPLQAIINYPQLDLDLTVSDRLAQLWNSSGTGAVQCAGQTTNRRTYPIWERLDTAYRALGQPLRVGSISSDCASAGVPPVLTELIGGRTFVMEDDGFGADQVANDGSFVTEWTSDTPVKDVLDISNDDQLEVYALSHYEAEEQPFQWRTLQADPQYPSYFFFTPPFPLLFGGLEPGNGIEGDVGVGRELGLALDGWFVYGATGFVIPGSPGTIHNYPTIGPFTGRPQLIPFFSNMRIEPSYIDWDIPEPEVQGTAPNREWIIEWANYSFDDCEADNVSIQMVLFESSPDILLNFRSVATNCDGVLPKIFLTHNFDSWHLFDNVLSAPMSLLLRPKTGPVNRSPESLNPIPLQTIVHGDTFHLDLRPHFHDPDGDMLSYFLGRDSKYVEIDANGILTARFPYHEPSEIPAASIEVGAHDGYLSARATFEVVFDNQSNQPPELVRALPEFEGVVGHPVSFDLSQYFEDPDGDPVIIVELDASDGMLRVYDLTSLVVNSSYEGQTETRDYLAVDGQFALQFSITARAISVPDTAPLLVSAIPDKTVRVGEYMRVPLYKYFATDQWGRISYRVNSGPAMRIEGFNPVLQAVFTDAERANSPYVVEIRAIRTGTNLESLTTFKLMILPENQPPAVIRSGTVDVTPNQAFNVPLTNVFNDPEGDQMFFVVTGLPAGLEELSPGIISGTSGDVGGFSFTVRATDALGASFVSTINISVAAPPPPPPSVPPPSGGGGGGSGGGSVGFIFLSFLMLMAIRLRLFVRARRIVTGQPIQMVQLVHGF